MKSILVATAVVLFAAAMVARGADLQAGLDAYKAGHYAQALSEFRPLAEGGDAVAQYDLGVML